MPGGCGESAGAVGFGVPGIKEGRWGRPVVATDFGPLFHELSGEESLEPDWGWW